MKKSILVVDDEELERELLRQIFESEYNVLTAANGKEALIQLSKNYGEIVIILLDISMPVLNGYQLLQVLHASEAYRGIPVAMITAADSQDLELACYTMGAVLVVNKPFSTQIVHNQINSIIELYDSSRRVRDNLTEKLKNATLFYNSLIDSISSIAEFRYFEAGSHIKRIKGLTRIFATNYIRMFPTCGLTMDDIDIIEQAAAVHDIGKIAIPDQILSKPTPLTEDEKQLLRSHTTKGCEVLSVLSELESPLYQTFYDVCRSHHERYDGSGYPDGLAGDNIPLAAQFVSIVHSYETLLSKRVYKKPYDKETAYTMIVTGKRGVFSPKLLQCFEQSRTAMETFLNNIR